MDYAALVWIVVGAGLLVLEVLFTGFVAVFFGIAAMVTGIAIAVGLPGDGALPWLLFSVLAVGLLVTLRRRFADWFRGRVVGDGSASGADDDFIGHHAEVSAGFGTTQHGEVNYRGAAWAARSAVPLAVGDRVTITGREQMTLVVAPATDP